MDGLFSSPLVQTAIALVGVWFVAALVCSGIIQLVGMALGFKAKNLWLALGTMLETPTSGTKPKRSASEAGALLKRLPTPEPGTPFAEVIQMLPGVTRDTLVRVSAIDREAAVSALTRAASIEAGSADAVTIRADFANTPLGQVVTALPDGIQHDAVKLRGWFDQWFDGQMSHLSRTYRSHIRWYTAFVGIVFALVLHVDSLSVAKELYAKPTTRQLLVAEAERAVADGDASAVGCKEKDLEAQARCIERQVDKFESFDVIAVHSWPPKWPDGPIGWQLIGIAITAGAIAAGAPFWYDVLRRLMGLKPKAAPQATATITQG